MAKKKPSKKTARKSPAKRSSPAKRPPSRGGSGKQIYTLEVFLIDGPFTEKFAKKNPVVSRTIQIRGDQTLDDLHEAIFDAFDRFDPHMHEFQFGKRPMDPDGPRYVTGHAFGTDDGGPRPAGRTDRATIDSLSLHVHQPFGYWFDFGDDWWHQINVESIEDTRPEGKYPKVIKRTGQSPPQYAEEE